MRTIINKPALAAVLIGSQLLVSFSCGKGIFAPGCGRGGSVYSFLASAEWSPQKEVYKVGDTLYLTSIIPKKLTDQINTSIVVDYSNSDGIYGNLTVYKLDTTLKDVLYAADKFDYHNIKGGVLKTSNLKIKYTYYEEVPSSYNLMLSIVAKEKGIYAIYISNLLSSGLRGKNCTKATFVNTLTNTNKNLNLFQYVMQRPPASQYEIDRIYCFRVQ